MKCLICSKDFIGITFDGGHLCFPCIEDIKAGKFDISAPFPIETEE